jgi:hypothetical protein
MEAKIIYQPPSLNLFIRTSVYVRKKNPWPHTIYFLKKGGDMFVNTSWLPAHQNCELKCRMDSEICQMSSENVIIRRQRCYECNEWIIVWKMHSQNVVPIECRRRLKQLLGGAELYTKPRRREGPATAAGPRAALKVQKQKQHNKQLAG